MNEYVTWQAAVLSVTCGVPLAFAFLVRGGRRRPLRCVFEAGAASVGLLVPWLYVAWRTRSFGLRPADLYDLGEILVVLIVTFVLIHGALGAWLGGKLERGTESAAAPGGRRVIRVGSVAARVLGVSVVALGLWCGWTISDGMGYRGGLLSMLFPDESEIVTWHHVRRGCVPFGWAREQDFWCPLPIRRFLVLATSVSLPFLAVALVRGLARRRSASRDRGRPR